MKRDLAIVAAAVSAGIHAALAPAHGMPFVAAAVLLAAAAVWLTLRPSSTLAAVGAACVFGGLLGAYAAAVGVGGEPLDALALATKAIEAAGLVAAIWDSKGAFRWKPHVRDARFLWA